MERRQLQEREEEGVTYMKIDIIPTMWNYAIAPEGVEIPKPEIDQLLKDVKTILDSYGRY